MPATPAKPSTTGAFVQLIEYSSDRAEQIQSLIHEWVTAIGASRTARWYVVTTDRDQPTRHVQLVEFPDYAAAMANSDHPATAKFAESLRQLVDGEPSFRNLDVIAAADLSGGT